MTKYETPIVEIIEFEEADISTLNVSGAGHDAEFDEWLNAGSSVTE